MYLGLYEIVIQIRSVILWKERNTDGAGPKQDGPGAATNQAMPPLQHRLRRHSAKRFCL